MNDKKLTNQYKGTNGENVAANFLLQKGYNIIERNWRYKHWEIDLIVSKENKLHFIEVKTRTSKQFGNPEESIGTKKMTALKNGIEQYLLQHTKWLLIQIDVVAIIMNNEKVEEIFFIEDVFF
jgi:putative endonuclease